MEFRAVGAKLFCVDWHAHRQTYDKANSQFRNFANIYKKAKTCNTRFRKQDPFLSYGTKIDGRAPTQKAPGQTATFSLRTLRFSFPILHIFLTTDKHNTRL